MEMNRRQFCALGTAGALAAIAGGVSLGCSSEGASKDAPAAAAAGPADVAHQCRLFPHCGYMRL